MAFKLRVIMAAVSVIFLRSLSFIKAQMFSIEFTYVRRLLGTVQDFDAIVLFSLHRRYWCFGGIIFL